MWTPEEIRRSRDAMVSAIREAGGDVSTAGNCRCPFHDDRSPSASIKLMDKGFWHFQCYPCNWGGDVFDVVQRSRGCAFAEAKDIVASFVGGEPPQAPQPKGPRVFPSPQSAARNYAEWKGGTVESVCQWSMNWHRARIALPGGKKTFLEITRHASGWIQKAPPRPSVLYRVREIPASGPVAVHEGEKCCDASWRIGIPAVTSGGSNSAGLADWSPLAGRMVAIFPDNDEPGRKYAIAVAEILIGLDPPAQVKIVSLPGLPAGGDVVDFIRRRGQ